MYRRSVSSSIASHPSRGGCHRRGFLLKIRTTMFETGAVPLVAQERLGRPPVLAPQTSWALVAVWSLLDGINHQFTQPEPFNTSPPPLLIAIGFSGIQEIEGFVSTGRERRQYR
jgi:hypothetical protein